MKCKAPFVHIRQDQDGMIAPCSSSFDMFENAIVGKTVSNLQDFFDGKEYTEFRNKMNRGEYIKGCIECKKDFELDIPSHRDYFNSKYSDVVEPKIRELELCISNLCNFKCVMCNGTFSSSWYSREFELEKLGIDRKYIIPKQKYLRSSHDITSLDLSELNSLRLLGGEPFADINFLQVFQHLDKINIIDKIELNLNTNNSIFPSLKWMKYLLKFKKINLVLSIDSIKELGEFCRQGMNFSVFDRNRKRWEDLATNHNIEISYNTVAHVWSVFGLNELSDYLELPVTFGVEGFGHAIDMTLKPDYLTLLYLPNPLKDKISNYLDVKFDKIIEFMYSESFQIEYCKQLITYYEYFISNKIKLPKIIQDINEIICSCCS